MHTTAGCAGIVAAEVASTSQSRLDSRATSIQLIWVLHWHPPFSPLGWGQDAVSSSVVDCVWMRALGALLPLIIPRQSVSERLPERESASYPVISWDSEILAAAWP